MLIETRQAMRFDDCELSGIGSNPPAYFSCMSGESAILHSTAKLSRGVATGVSWSVRQWIALISAEDHRSRPWPDDVRATLETYTGPPA